MTTTPAGLQAGARQMGAAAITAYIASCRGVVRTVVLMREYGLTDSEIWDQFRRGGIDPSELQAVMEKGDER